MGVAPQLQPLEGMLLRRSTDIYPKELARDMREFFNSLLDSSPRQSSFLVLTARGALLGLAALLFEGKDSNRFFRPVRRIGSYTLLQAGKRICAMFLSLGFGRQCPCSSVGRARPW